MLCPVCHTENLDDALTCSSCSSSLNLVLGQTGNQSRPSDSFEAPTLAPSSVAKFLKFETGLRNPIGAAAAAPAVAPEITPEFGARYRVDGKLGEGGMGSVYKAYDLELDRTVALKVIRPELMANTEILQRFKQELLLASKISHKHILRIHDLGEAGGDRKSTRLNSSHSSISYAVFCLKKKKKKKKKNNKTKKKKKKKKKEIIKELFIMNTDKR